MATTRDRDPDSTTSVASKVAPRGSTRRGALQQLALIVVGLPLLRLGETLAVAERRRRHHRGDSDEIWIGHC